MRPAGFEPTAYRVGVCHSIQLSYERADCQNTGIVYHSIREMQTKRTEHREENG